jgi:hypothetical protein
MLNPGPCAYEASDLLLSYAPLCHFDYVLLNFAKMC